MKQTIIANKEGSNVFGLYSLALERIKECEEVNGKIIPFPKVFEKLCRSFQIKKPQCWEILFILRDFEMIEIVKFHGVRIK
jgi:hypothetical protein